jgi:hypothetical protein
VASPSSSFTTTAIGGLLNVLKNQCGISQAFDPTGGGNMPPVLPFDAIWDTGATNSCISQAVIDACGLLPIGMAEVHGVQSSTIEEVFLINVYLPNHVAFIGVQATRGKFPGADILIGMDLINQGDFAVTNNAGITKFSFRVPSQKHIDFVQEHNERELKERFKHGGSKQKRPKQHKTFGRNKHKKR